MKRLFILLALIVIGSAAFAKSYARPQVEILSTKRDIFYFRVSDAFIGATVTVIDESGQELISEKISSHKSIVDFYCEKAGHYTIRITKGEHNEEFGYFKSSPSPFISDNTDFHLTISRR